MVGKRHRAHAHRTQHRFPVHRGTCRPSALHGRPRRHPTRCVDPAPAGPTGKVPLLLNMHGGPATQYGFGFFDEFQIYVCRPGSVWWRATRGSSGRGTDFRPGTRGSLGRGAAPGSRGHPPSSMRHWSDSIDRCRPHGNHGGHGGFMTGSHPSARSPVEVSRARARCVLMDPLPERPTSDSGFPHPLPRRLTLRPLGHPVGRQSALPERTRSPPCLFIHSGRRLPVPHRTGRAVLCGARRTRCRGGDAALSRQRS